MACSTSTVGGPAGSLMAARYALLDTRSAKQLDVSAVAATYHPNIRVERDEHVTTVTLDRPEAKNACTGDMWVAIGRTFQDIAHSGTRVVVLTGAGGEFCAGADLA